MRYLMIFILSCVLLGSVNAAEERPNVILIFTDDQGYGDVGCYGAKGFKTPNLDQMAKEGMKFTSFYVGCAVCSGSRAALMTGSHYRRVSIAPVLFPRNRNGLNPKEITIAEVVKPLGYSTGVIGKWHLGHLKPFLPTNQGFDYYYGIPYSNDMWLDNENAEFDDDCKFRMGMTLEKAKTEKYKRNWVPLMQGTKVVEYPADQTTVTKRYTEEAVKYIHNHKDKPFFLYLPHTMPHLPMAVSKDFKGRTKTLFGDVMEEIDWSVGEILKALKESGIDKKTLVIFTTDNGTRMGSSGPLRGRKASVYEGGIRVPCIMRWPGKVPEGSTCDEIAATIDMLPTIAKFTGGKVPTDRTLDGKDISDLILGKEGAKSPHEYYIMHHNRGGIRSGHWKFYPWPEGRERNRQPKKPLPKDKPKVQLYDLSKDLGEKNNVAATNPQVVERLHGVFRKFVEDINKNKRPIGQVKKGS